MLPNYPYADTFLLRASLYLQSAAPLRCGRHRLRISLKDVYWDGAGQVLARFGTILGFHLATPGGVTVVSCTPVLNAPGGDVVAALDLVLDVEAPSLAFNAVLLRVWGRGPALSVNLPGLLVLPETSTSSAPIVATRADGLALKVAWRFSPDIRAVVGLDTHALTFPTPSRNYRVDVDFSALGTFFDVLYSSHIAPVVAAGAAIPAIEASENLTRKTKGKTSFTIFAPDDGDPVYTLALTVNVRVLVAGWGWSAQALNGAATWSEPILLS